MSPCARYLKPSRKPMTSNPLLMPSMVAAAMTPLMPGAGPPPTKMPNLPLLLINLMQDARAPGKIQFHSCQKPTTICQMNRAVFLDRDGTMIVEKNYLCRPEDVDIFPATPAGLKRLAGAGFKLFILFNQSCARPRRLAA